MNDRNKYRVKIVISSIVILIFGSFFLSKLHYMITTDKAYQGNNEDGGAITLDRNNPVENALADISLSRSNINKDIEAILEDSEIPEGIKHYFKDFEEFNRAISATKDENVTTSLSTMSFINNASILKDYFKDDKPEEFFAKASIVPYYFIKNYDSLNKKQKNEKAIYKAYIDNFVTGRISLDRPGANVICLYVYACYESATTFQSASELTSLKEEIEKFLDSYKNDLADNGEMSIQSTYLNKAKEILRNRPNRKGILVYKLKPYPNSNL